MFFITTDTNTSIDKLVSRTFTFCSLQNKKNPIVIKYNNLNAAFYNCKKVELSEHTVLINGDVFPDKTETLNSALKKSIQQGNGKRFLHGNFNLIVFNKDPVRDNSFSILSDRHGTVPCFFCQENNLIKISSVLHFFLHDKTGLNEQSLLNYLCLGYTFPEESLWNAIETIPKGKTLTVFPDKNQMIIKDNVTKTKAQVKEVTPFQSLKECAKYFFETLNQVISDQFKFAKVNNMFLTGGSDTRMLLSCMSQEQRNQLLYITYDTPHWSGTNNDLLVAKLIAKAFNLRHQSYPFNKYTNKQINEVIKYPQSKQETHYEILTEIRFISGRFGSELFGGGAFNTSLFTLDFVFAANLDSLKNKLLQSLITAQHYEKIGSPWQKLNQKILSMNTLNREGAFILQMLLRSQFTSIYSRSNVSDFIIPSKHHFSMSLFPYIDTRMIDFFLRCPREFLLNYSLYEYIFTHFSEKKLIEIPFHSNMMKFVESLKKMDTGIIVKNIGAKGSCNYKKYFEKHFSPSLFEGTFLEKLSNTDVHKIPEPFLSRICDLTCFLSELQRQ